MKNFEFYNQVIPHAIWVVQDAEKMLHGEPHWLEQSVKNFQSAIKQAAEDSDKNELRCEVRWKEEKEDISKRLGHPGLEPWCAADIVIQERNALASELAKLKEKV